MELKYVDVKVKRLEREYSALTEELYAEATEKIKEYIETMKNENGMNVIFHNHPEPKSIDDAVTNKLEYVVGKVDDIDDEYMYCRIFEDKMEYINFENLRAQALYLAELDRGKKHIKRICRIELKPLCTEIFEL